MVQGAYSAGYGKGADGEESQWELDYKRVLGEVEAFTVRMGRRPRILVAKMGQDGTSTLIVNLALSNSY